MLGMCAYYKLVQLENDYFADCSFSKLIALRWGAL